MVAPHTPKSSSWDYSQPVVPPWEPMFGVVVRNGVRTEFGPEKSGFLLKTGLRTLRTKMRTLNGPYGPVLWAKVKNFSFPNIKFFMHFKTFRLDSTLGSIP